MEREGSWCACYRRSFQPEDSVKKLISFFLKKVVSEGDSFKSKKMQLKVSFCHLPFDRFWQWCQQHHKERSPECSSLWKIILWQPQNSNWFVVVTVKLKSWWRHGSVQNRYQPQYLLLVCSKCEDSYRWFCSTKLSYDVSEQTCQNGLL